MAAHVGLWQVENQPAVSDVRSWKTKLISEKRPQILRLRRVKHRMDTGDHRSLLQHVGKAAKSRHASYHGRVAPHAAHWRGFICCCTLGGFSLIANKSWRTPTGVICCHGLK